MNDFENRLREALRREEPAPGFTEAVLRRVRNAPAPAPRRRWLAAAALVLLTLGAAAGLEHRQRQRSQAQAQLRLALEVSSEQLNQVFRKLQTTQEN